jgi:hypothetical protein
MGLSDTQILTILRNASLDITLIKVPAYNDLHTLLLIALLLLTTSQDVQRSAQSAQARWRLLAD